MQIGSSIILPSSVPLALPELPIAVRVGTRDDLAFMDELQKLHAKQVGWMPTQQLEGKIKAGQVLVAEGAERIGYVIGHDQYFKRDDVGIVYQMNVAPGAQRKLVGATLLKALFDRAAYGCRLFCCWCAQDIAANHFWEAMGFVPLAFRTGGRTKGKRAADKNGCPARMHIFWQRRIREGDTSTPYWFPSRTTGGSIREDRLVLPMPIGSHWSAAKPMVLPGEVRDQGSEVSERKRLAGPRGLKTTPAARPNAIVAGGLRFAPAVSTSTSGPSPLPSPPSTGEREKRSPRRMNDPKLVAAVRELRDRYLERVNGEELLSCGNARYTIYGIASAVAGERERLALPAA